MKTVAGFLLMMVMVGILGGCSATACQQPAPAPMNMKGEG